MQYLKDSEISGSRRYVSRLRKKFDLVYVGTPPESEGAAKFQLTRVLANRGYVGVSYTGIRPTIKRNPLYILVPDRSLDGVWVPPKNQLTVSVCKSGEVEVRFGPASRCGGLFICDAVGIRIDNEVLYLCMNENGKFVDDSCNMGV